MTTRDDSELFEAWRAGDSEAGEQLVERHFAAVYRFFRRKLDDPELVRELAQNTFLAVVESSERVREGVRFRAFALGVARNVLGDCLRGRARRKHRRPRATPTPLQTTPSQVVVRREEQRVLLRALRVLPLDLQIALEMHYWEGLTTAEIGQVLDIPSGTVKWRLVRARDLLREKIAELANDALRLSTLQDLDGWAASLREPD